MPGSIAVSGCADAPVDKLQESLRSIKIEDNNHEGGGRGEDPRQSNNNSVADKVAVAAQDGRGVPDCIFYLRHGICGYGSTCRYNHPTNPAQEHLPLGELPERVGQPDCQHFLRTGTCRYGYTCKYNHPKNGLDEGHMSFNIYGLPMRQGERSCPYYMRTGYCKFGFACKFNHPQPSATPGTAFPLPGSSSYASVGSFITSPTGHPLVGGISAWPPRPYMSNSQINGFPSYLPYVFPSSQGIIPAQHGWNTYTAPISSVSSTNAVGTAGQISNSSQLSFGSSTQFQFPERPDQPDCQYYMKNGSCKYGSTCKYHHPRDRINSSAACIIGPLGLPMRPGQAICTFYRTYGSCKYGLGCKFDHPPMGGYCNYALPSGSDPSVLLPSQKGFSAVWIPSDAGSYKTSKVMTDGVPSSESASIKVDSNLSDEAPPKSCTQNSSSETPQDQSD